MIKKVIKSVLGKGNVKRINRVRQTLSYARQMWRNSSDMAQNYPDRIALSCLMQIHGFEKALAVNNTRTLEAVNYSRLIERLQELLNLGMSPDNFVIRETAAVLKSVLDGLNGHEDDKKALDDFIAWNDIAMDFRGGVERITREEIFSHTNFDFGAFVRSRHSVRRFKDKIISSELIREIVNDALYCPSACNRQPFRVYFSENPQTVSRIIKCIPDQFVARNVHDALIVTCDRTLLSQSELHDQEYLNGGIFLGFLVLSIHAHGLGSCLFQFLQASSRQDAIRREFGISAGEVISAFVGIGEVEDEVLCACAQRRPIDEVLVKL